jgi:pimeloyl-ACP methyl ester carboxylesterase
MDLEDWKSAGKWLPHKGHSVFWREDGPPQAEALLCIHGFPTASWDWHRLWPELTRRFHVLALDMLGYGFSDKPTRYDYNTFDQADLHEALLRERGVDRVHVLAHDYGDTVAQELLARLEERRDRGAGGLQIASVCLLNGGLFPETYRIRPIQELLLSPLGPLVGRLMNERRFGKSFAAVFGPRTKPTPEEIRQFWALVTRGGGRRVAHKLLRYVHERRRHRERWVGALQRTSVPLRLVNGPEDPVSGRNVVERWRQLLPEADLVVLDGIGHYPQVEDPQGVLRAFLEFLERPAAGRAARAAANAASGPQPKLETEDGRRENERTQRPTDRSDQDQDERPEPRQTHTATPSRLPTPDPRLPHTHA